MNILKTTLGLLFTLLLAMPAETFAQSAGGQISRRAKTAVKKESPAKKKTPRKNTAKQRASNKATSKSTAKKPAAKKAVRSSKPIPEGAVDLGLPSGTLWADRNIGASSPEDCGDYFAWGDTSPKSVYDWNAYKYCRGTKKTMTKYNYKRSYGKVDNKTTLEPDDDAATANWGSSWRMPTYEEHLELRKKCTWTWTTQNGMKGYKVTGPNGNSIFLPAAGLRNDSGVSETGSYGYYWLASLNEIRPYYAWIMYFGLERRNSYYYYHYRCEGRSVRAVAR